MQSRLRAALGILLGLVARLWLSTLRVRVVVHPSLEAAERRPWVLSFFHGTQWPLLAWRRRGPTVALVSLSADGAMQSWALRLQGLAVVRGSTSRGGARGLAALVRAMRRHAMDAAFAVDGPRGPRGLAQGGAVVAARSSGGVLVPMGSAAPSGITLARAWDRFRIAWPFSAVTVVLGAPIEPTEPEALFRLQNAIAEANASAESWLEGQASCVVS